MSHSHPEDRVSDEIALPLPDRLLDEIAERIAERVIAHLDREAGQDSPWLDVAAACGYLGFSRDQLWKLTAAKAIRTERSMADRACSSTVTSSTGGSRRRTAERAHTCREQSYCQRVSHQSG